MAPTRSSPCTRKPRLGPTTFHPARFAACLNAAASAGMKSSCARRPCGNAENASKLTPASFSVLSARAPSPGLSGAVV